MIFDKESGYHWDFISFSEAMAELLAVDACAVDSAADNECAEILLQLAMSAAPSASTAGPRTYRVSFGSPAGQNASHSPASESTPESKNESFGSGFTEEQDFEEPNVNNQLLRYIRQDHSYAEPVDGAPRSADYTAAFHMNIGSDSLMEDVLGDDVGVPPRWNKENAFDNLQKSTHRRSPYKRTRPYYGSCPRKNYTASAAQTGKHDSSSGNLSSSNKGRHNKFQLLLKCLIANDPVEKEMFAFEGPQNTPRGLSRPKVKAAGQNISGKIKPEKDDDCENGDLESSDIEGDSQYVCPDCPKTFTKRRYLTKHVRRMHPETEIPDMKDGVATACPNCFCVIQRRNFHRHLDVCDVEMSRSKNQRLHPDSDFVFCQFCGAQMKRQLLGKHLAKEHCIDRHTVQFEDEFSKFQADEEDASLYPSDNSHPSRETSRTLTAVQDKGVSTESKPKVDVSALIVPCPKCNISISDDLLARHMALDHEIFIDNASALAASRCSCKHSMLQAYLDGTAETKSINNNPCEACVQSLSTLGEHCSATVSAHSSDRLALSSPLSGISSTSPVKSVPGSSSTVSAEETRMQVSLLEDTALALLKCAAAPVARV